MSTTQIELGPCCGCYTGRGVRNIVNLPLRAAEPGSGWGCVVCGLTKDGALAVLCDSCIQSGKLQTICVGHPKNERRESLKDAADRGAFEHDPNKHAKAGEHGEVGVA